MRQASCGVDLPALHQLAITAIPLALIDRPCEMALCNISQFRDCHICVESVQMDEELQDASECWSLSLICKSTSIPVL